MASATALSLLKQWVEDKRESVYTNTNFQLLATEFDCIRYAVTAEYIKIMDSSQDPPKIDGDRKDTLRNAINKAKNYYDNSAVTINSRSALLKNIDPTDDANIQNYANRVFLIKPDVANAILERCYNANISETTSEKILSTINTETRNPELIKDQPFDKRLNRLKLDLPIEKLKSDGYLPVIVPYSMQQYDLATSGYLSTTEYIIGSDTLNEVDDDSLRTDFLRKSQAAYEKMKQNDFYKGVPALQNYYAIVRLYSGQGNKKLINKKGDRRWYEIDSTSAAAYNYASVPTTSSIISWGNGDPFGRTPYQFTDFVFSKYWNKIENNRLITLRRYAAPILDNLKFPGMNKQSIAQNSESGGDSSPSSSEEPGSVKVDSFPPMATAITYFGGETGNSLNSLLKFTTGVSWEDVQADVWEVQTDEIPSSRSGPGRIFGSLARFAEMLNVAGGNFDKELAWNAGHLPPDPYKDGPYENRIMGPMNRIDTVKKRKPGLSFEWEGLDLVFEYVARPVGGINPKAVLLDILSNFLVMGSANAVFFGGAHRFMADPATYPFIGGGKGAELWYSGQPLKWATTVVNQFAKGGAEAAENYSPRDIASNLWKNVEGFFNNLFSGKKGSIFGAVSNLFTGATGNIIENELAKGTGGHVPYLTGMKAILTGEPVGEWHVTIGNPFNPIAMIGNLVCDGITVEFNEELGPDDFPTEMKITVKLKHAMARDKGSIESIFNRGMGRIYNLPDSMAGSADFQTVVDKATEKDGRVKTGTAPGRRDSWRWQPGLDGRYLAGDLEGSDLSLGGETTIWNRGSFYHEGISDNSAVQFIPPDNAIYINSYRTADWIAQRSLK